jgi:hypothetical protein
LNITRSRTLRKTIVLLYFIILAWSLADLNAQYVLEGQMDLGNNNLSRGLYLQFSNIGYYEKQYWGMQAGYQLGLVQPQDVFFNSWYVNAYGKIPLGKIKLDLGGEYLWAAFSPEMREINWIVLAKTSLKHWRFALGNNSRIYRLSRETAKTDSEADPESRIIEGGNMMYSAGFMLKTDENRWNLTLTITDYDHFIIQQETNPIANIRFDYRLKEPICLYSELWYKSAGFFNIRVNYFGMLFRIGMQWKL